MKRANFYYISLPFPPKLDIASLSNPQIPSIRADMAARNLAINLQKSLRGRTAITQLKQGVNSGLTRSFATPHSHGAKTECTTLNNGFTV